jgi:hypothetical protein
VTITLYGHVPSKKNGWGPRRGGGIILDLQMAREIEWLMAELTIKRSVDKPEKLEHPQLRVTFYVRSRASDRDNKLSTILDILQKAGVLRNDNIAHCNGRLVLEPAVCVGRDGEEKTVIEIN